MKTIAIGLLLLFLACASSGQANNTKKNKADPARRGMTADQQGQGKMDINLSRKIRQALLGHKGLSRNARNIKIISNDGRVVLRGKVDSDAEKTAIQRLADEVAGAAQVTNHLEVTAPPHSQY